MKKIFLSLFVMLCAALPAHAELRIEINRGNVDPLPIAIPNFYAPHAGQDKVAKDMAGVIAADLERSGLFAPIDPTAFLQTPKEIVEKPRFEDWRLINAQALVSGTVTQEPDGKLKVEFRLWDVFASNQMTGFVYRTTPEGWRRTSHLIADAIYKRITGEDGYFDTRIVYVSETGSALKRIRRLAIMDQDGENHRFITDGENLVLTPRFSPIKHEIAYLGFYNNKARVYIVNIDTGKRQSIGEFPGMSFAPRFSPDGKTLLFSIAQNGATNIYTMDLETKKTTQLTNTPAISTAATFSPDGKQIVFSSDRGGAQALYTMDADGSNVKRITFGKGNYATPVWSPRGDLIAFTKQSGDFAIGVIRPDGSGERLLESDYHAEGPTWSPNGRVLMFFKEKPSSDKKKGSVSKLYSIDITGFNLREVVTPMDGAHPAWSPLIP